MATDLQDARSDDRGGTGDDPVAGRLDAPLDEYYRQIAALRAAAGELCAGLDEAQIHWRPDPGSWSMAQCLRHLVAINRGYLEPCDAVLAAAPARRQAGGGGRYNLLERWLVRFLEPPPRRRVPAPRKAQPTAGDVGSAAEVVGEYQAVCDEILRRLVRGSDVDHHRLKVRSPYFPLLAFRLGALFAIVAAHDRRHLWQARRLRRHPAFPAARVAA